MKKKPKKLVLAKETLRGLNSFDLAGIAGGDATETRFLRCWTTLGCPNTT